MVNLFYRSLFIAALMSLVSAEAGAEIIGHWKLDETEGITAADSINGNNGTYIPNPDTESVGYDPVPGWQTGLIGGAAGLNDEDDGVQEYFVIPSIPQMANSQQLSISIWFNQNDGPNENDGNNGLIRVRNLMLENTNGNRTAGMNTESGHIDARINSNANDCAVDGGSFTDDPGWHNALMVWDGTDDSGGADTGLTKLYLDGGLVSSESNTALADKITESGEWWIGGVDCCGTTRGWTGALDDLAMWDEVLPPELVQNIYFDGLVGLDAKTVYDEFLIPKTPGDVNGDGKVTSADYAIIKANFRGENKFLREQGDLVNNNKVDLDDYLQWLRAPKDPEGTAAGCVPEPASLVLLFAAAPLICLRYRR